MTLNSSPRHRGVGRFTRLRVVSASALVLGVGATVTLASWNDSETVKASFTAGTFGIVGSATGTDFIDHPAATPAALAFSLTPTAMIPGSVTYALYSVKSVTNSVAGTLKVAADPANVAPTTLGSHLTYGIRTVTGTACNGTAFTAAGSVEVVPSGSTLSTGSATPVPIAASGGQVNYCFQITLPTTASNEAQGRSVDASWTITAEAAAPSP